MREAALVALVIIFLAFGALFYTFGYPIAGLILLVAAFVLWVGEIR